MKKLLPLFSLMLLVGRSEKGLETIEVTG